MGGVTGADWKIRPSLRLSVGPGLTFVNRSERLSRETFARAIESCWNQS